VGWSAPCVGRDDNHARSASAQVPCGRSAGSPQGEARPSRVAQASKAMVKTLRNRSRRPVAVPVQKSLNTWRGIERHALAAKTTTPSPTARTCSVGGRLVLHRAKCARVARLKIRKLRSRHLETVAADQSRFRCRRTSAHGVGWSVSRWPRRQPRQVRRRARALWAVGWFSTR